MSEKNFANYDPTPTRRALCNYRVRLACDEDLQGLVRIAHEREGPTDVGVGALTAGMSRRLDFSAEKGRLFVAEGEDGGLLGYGASAYMNFPRDGTLPEPVHDCWYLTGVVVTPSARRASIGRALTVARIDAWSSCGGPLRFVANANNRPSIVLHEELGFELEAREFNMPGVEFTSSKGLLYRLDPVT
ncbi:MAG: ribosomal protein S18 acetylase RimI-like enzyme [Candidatus Paceibacteria bacterium]|jgi:ribosomal protein S18 acetylase RimI-like enzyme